MQVNWVVFLFLATLGMCVKDYMFKDCDQSGFCHRNLKFSEHVSGNPQFRSQYNIDEASVGVVGGKSSGSDEGDVVISGDVVKHLPKLSEPVVLPFELSLLTGNKFRFKIQEPRLKVKAPTKYVNTNRYNETSKWSFVSEDLDYEKLDLVKYSKTLTSLSIEFGKFTVVVEFSGVKIKVYCGKELQLLINDENFLNFEHHRYQNENHLHMIDEEIDYNMFRDDFHDSRFDTFPLGPESVALDFTFKGFDHIYGIPEHANSLSLKDTTNSKYLYRLFNVDIFEYETESNFPMYGSIPFMLASKPGHSIGLFWVNAADTYVNVKKLKHDSMSHWISENGIIDFVVFLGDTPQDINKYYGEITGYTSLPQLFALGYHQCRWNYNDEEDVLDITAQFDNHQIPYDTIWLDVGYTDTRKYFTWEPDAFPDPERMLNILDQTGRNMVIIIDPHFKLGYEVSDTIDKKRITINNSKNETFRGQCWPGESLWIDSFNPNAKPYWDELHRYSSDNKVFGKAQNIHLWNDMSEISVFDGPETSSPKDNIHYNGWEERSVHNLNGLKFHEMTYDTMTKRLLGVDRQRPFILTRSYFAGSQRTAAQWTGDNMAKWEYLKISIPMVLSNGVAGMPFAGVDVGGFFGNPSNELLTRWYQTGIWYPFFRAHAHLDSKRREPWVPGDPYTSIIREAIQLRYSLLPELYSAFYESSINGLPVLKPLFYETPENLNTYDVDDEFFLGNSGLLVKPITEKDTKQVDILLPKKNEVYYDYTDGKPSHLVYKNQEVVTKSVNLSNIPMMLQGGSILFRKNRYRRSAALMKNDPYTLVIGLNNKGSASGQLYIDDYESFKYLDDNYMVLEVESTNKQISSEIIKGGSEFIESVPNHIEKIIVLNHKGVNSITIKQGDSKVIGEFEYEGNNMIIKRPNVKINSGWKVEMGYDKGHDEL